MELKAVITTRRAIRKYKPDPIPENKLQSLYNALQAAPSGNNRQPFKFIFVKNPELRRKIVSQACNKEFLMQPPVLMVACCEKGDSFNVAIAADHMILAATDEGLGTCWVAWFDAEKVKALLDIPADFDVPVIVPIGFADESPVQRPRKSLEELITVI
jgi:nitroreductase